MPDVIITVGAEADQASVDAAAADAGKDFGKGFLSSSKKALGNAESLFKDVEAAIKRIKGLQTNLGKTGLDVGQFAPLQRGLERLLALQREFEADRKRLSKDTSFLKLLKQETDAVQALTSSQTRELQSTVAATNVQARAEAHAADREAAARNIALQRDAALQVNAARTAGKARIVIAQQIGAQLLSFERILSNGITNIIRGTSKAVGAVWQSTVGSLRRTFSERKTIVEGGLKNESRLFSQNTVISQRANSGLLGTISNNLGTIGGGFAIGAAARQIFTLGSEFTRGLNVLQAQLQLTGDQMKEVNDLAIKLGNDISLPGVSALDAANAIGLLSKQFAALGPAAIGAAEAAAQGTLRLARAVGAAPEEAAAAVGAAVNVFGENAANATQVADQLAAALSQAAGTSFTDFSQAFTQGAAVVSSFIVPADGATNAITEFSASLAVLARGGLVGSDAGTSIKQFFLQANRGTDDVNTALAEVSARAGETGTAFFDASGKARPLVNTIDILQRGLVGLTEEQRAQTLQTIFGSDATRVANILIGQGAAALLTAEAAVQRQGAAADLAAAQNKGLAGAIDAIKSQFQTFAIQIFQKVNPVLGDAGLKIAGFIDKLANGEGAFAVFRKAILGVAGAFGVLLALRGFTEIAGLIGSIVSLLGPFGVGIAVVGAIAGIATKGFSDFGGTLERVQEIVATVRDAIVTGLGFAFRFLQTQFQRIKPVIQPVIDRLSTFAQRVVDIGRSFQQAFQFGGLSNAFRNLRTNLASLGQDIGKFLAPIGKRLGEALVPVKDLAIGIKDRLVATFKSIDFGSIVSVIGDGIKKATSTSLGKALTGGGIGAVAGGLIAGPLGAALGAALGAGIGLAVPKIKQAISRINVADLFGKFLDGVNTVARKIGEILSDKRTILAVAGVAAAAAAIAAQFISGFVSGILSNLGDIAQAGAAILNALFDQGSIVKSIAALVLIFRKQLFSLLPKAGKEAGQAGGKAIAEGVEQGVASAGLGERVKRAATPIGQALSNIGKTAAKGLTVALAAGLSGSALGEASSNVEKGLSLAGLASSAATAFAVGGGQATGAALAAGTVGIGLLTAALSSNAKKAAEAKARMEEYKDAVARAGAEGKEASGAIEEVFTAKLLDASDKALRGLNDVGLSLTELKAEAGTGDLSPAVKKLNDELKITKDQATLLQQQGDVVGANKAIKKATDLEKALSFVNQQQKAITEEAKRTDLEKSLTPGAGFTRLGPAFQNIIDKIKETVREKAKLAADIRAEQLLIKAKTIEAGMKAIGDAAATSRQQILDLAKPIEAKTPETGGAEAVTGVAAVIPDVSQAFLTGLDTALGSAQLTTAIASLSGPLGSAVQDGLGNAFTPEQIASNLSVVKTAINQATTPDGQPISDEVKGALLQGVADFEAVNVPQIIEVQANADLRAAAAAGDQMADAALAAKGLSSGISVRAKADIASSLTAGGEIVNSADSIVANLPVKVKSTAVEQAAIEAGQTIHSKAQSEADKPLKVGSTVNANTTSAENAGKQVVKGLTSGIAGAIGFATKAITAVVNGVTSTATAEFRIRSPSKVFMGIGEDVIKGLAIGLTDSTDAAVSAAEEVAKAVIEATQSTATRLASASRSATGGIFSAIFDSAGVQAQQAAFDARIGITRALEGIADSVESEASALFSAASKAVAERTGADNRIIARSDFASAFNLSNQEAIKNAVDAIKAIGTSLIQQGSSAQAAADAMLAYRGALIGAAQAAGLNAAQVAGIVDQLGLSNTALSEFVRLSGQAGAIVGASPGFIPTEPPPLVPGPNAAQTFIINNEFATPFDDPQAVSLAVVNRLAQSVRR